MPHCIINYTRDVEQKIDIEKLLNVAFDAVDSSGLFSRASIKARAIGFDIFQSGQDRDDYIHIDLKILSGRTAEQKKTLSDHMINSLALFVGDTKSLTVDIIDMETEAYGKRIAEE